MLLQEEAFEPGTYTEVIIKIHSGPHCNFRCDNCYVFELQDTSYQRNPWVMSEATALLVAEQISDHVLRYALPYFKMILHGSEPTMAGIQLIRLLVSETRRRIAEKTGGACTLRVSMQTNGWLLHRMIDDLHELGVRVGVSVDGTRENHNRWRPLFSGGGSYDGVVSNIALMQEKYPDMFSGILCVIHVQDAAEETHESLISLGPPRIDYLWPHGDHTHLPPGLDPKKGTTPIADWLIAVWNNQLSQPEGAVLPRVRFFDLLIEQLRTGANPMELIGPPVRGALVIDSGGGYNMGDAFMSVADDMMVLLWRNTNLGFKSTRLRRGARMSVRNCTIHDAAITAMEVNRRLGIKGLASDGGPLLCDTCTSCKWRKDCGGGLYTTRWKEGSGFWNASVYCDDLKKIFEFASKVVEYLEAIERVKALAREQTVILSGIFRQRAEQLRLETLAARRP